MKNKTVNKILRWMLETGWSIKIHENDSFILQNGSFGGVVNILNLTVFDLIELHHAHGKHIALFNIKENKCI